MSATIGKQTPGWIPIWEHFKRTLAEGEGEAEGDCCFLKYTYGMSFKKQCYFLLVFFAVSSGKKGLGFSDYRKIPDNGFYFFFF